MTKCGIVAGAELICMVGLPYSGKTTWAKSRGCPIVSPDAIRVALHGQRFRIESEPMVWAVAHQMVRALFLAGHAVVVLDATNVTKARRSQWLSGDWITSYQLMPAWTEECASRAQKAGDEEILPVIGRMGAEFEPLSHDDVRHVAT